MGIVRGPDGKYYDIEDEVLEQNEVKPDDLPADMARGASGPPGAGGQPPPSGPGQGLVQIIVMPQSGPGPAGGPPSGPPPQGGEAEAGADVSAHNYCNWSNWNNWNNWNNWHNSWRNCY